MIKFFNALSEVVKASVLLCFTILPLFGFSQTARIAIDASHIMNQIPPKMYGSCIEDVNHEIYGGLYDQRLYGESFEEPAPTANFTGWKTLRGDWKIGDNGIGENTGPGYKLIRETPLIKDGGVEVDVKFIKNGREAGLLLRVNNELQGTDNFDGYGIVLMPRQHTLVLSKTTYNYRQLAETKVSFNEKEWTHLKVTVQGARIAVYLDNNTVPTLTYTDKNKPLLSGRIGLRAYNAGALFKDVIINANGTVIKNEFKEVAPSQISFAWDGIIDKTAQGAFMLDTTNAYIGKQAQIIAFTKGSGRIGITNSGLNRWGISVKQNQKFQGYICLRADELTGPVTVALQSVDGTKTYATQKITKVTSTWKKYPFSLTANTTDKMARFALYINKKGKLEIDQSILMSTGASQFRGLPIRADIATEMQKEGLNFVRYGGTLVNSPEYRWKNMIGSSDKRPQYLGHWYPYASNGFGIGEFVAYCEAAGFESAFAINVEESPEDIGDMIDYLTGDVSTPGGKRRAAKGHPKPYPVHYIELGNEEVIWGDIAKDYQHYAERFNLLYDVIHAKAPQIKVICSAWWKPGSPNMETLFKTINGRADYWDLHTDADEPRAGTAVDNNLQIMQDLFLKWDPNTKMRIAIFEENGGLHDLQRALGHATTLNAVRRHGDFVLTSCAANGLQPFMQHDNNWDQGQVFFTPSQVWGMPPFYATQMAAKNHQPLRVFNSVEGDLDVTAARSEKGDELVVHVVNTTANEIKTWVNLNGFAGKKPLVKIYTLSGDLKTENLPVTPEKTSTKTTTMLVTGDTMDYCFPAHSYSILRFEK